MATMITDVVEMVAEMMSLMEQMEMSGDLARRVRKALRQLQAADKERFIRMSYVTLCAAAKADDLEEIGDVFEDLCSEAARSQQQGAQPAAQPGEAA
ncbi:hypothetical protein GPECTOR_3g196 [Gonium pectorale]|uniref:Uncharacterized protein n=1 Tax=Gonium pectorale TaxID=33097 RepID=A0A150GZ10_GONPE|nr:hypothetical protein GPECTOR_3g196 [Gonium pectorale]|eukprot:KXZ55035.1 hypothetical protein GPECTOR_3g196 [Gonium pectorale]